MSEKKPFEKAIKELESIVTQLESGELPLEKSIALFDEGTQLSKLCETQLDQAQKKIDTLIQKIMPEHSAQTPKNT